MHHLYSWKNKICSNYWQMEWLFVTNAEHIKSVISRQGTRIIVFLFFPKPLRKRFTRRAISCFSTYVIQGFFGPGTKSTLYCYRCSSTSLFQKHSLYEIPDKGTYILSPTQLRNALQVWSFLSSFAIHSFHILNSNNFKQSQTKHLALFWFYHTSIKLEIWLLKSKGRLANMKLLYTRVR